MITLVSDNLSGNVYRKRDALWITVRTNLFLIINETKDPIISTVNRSPGRWYLSIILIGILTVLWCLKVLHVIHFVQNCFISWYILYQKNLSFIMPYVFIKVKCGTCALFRISSFRLCAAMYKLSLCEFCTFFKINIPSSFKLHFSYCFTFFFAVRLR